MKPRTKPNGVTEQMQRLKEQDENIARRVATMYDDKGMRYEQIAELLCVRIDTIRAIHNQYIEDRISQHKLDKKSNSVDKKIDTEL